MEAIERLRFLASFGPPSTGKRKGGKKTQPFNRFHSHPGNYFVEDFVSIPRLPCQRVNLKGGKLSPLQQPNPPPQYIQ